MLILSRSFYRWDTPEYIFLYYIIYNLMYNIMYIHIYIQTPEIFEQ